jgi:hypothetical protein
MESRQLLSGLSAAVNTSGSQLVRQHAEPLASTPFHRTGALLNTAVAGSRADAAVQAPGRMGHVVAVDGNRSREPGGAGDRRGVALQRRGTTYTYSTAAEAGFEQLENLYKKGKAEFGGHNGFWIAGNSLNTALQYLVTEHLKTGKDVAGDANTFLDNADGVFKSLAKSPGATADPWWRDDYGWWGNAFVYALQHRSDLGLGGKTYNGLFDRVLTQAEDCWSKLEDVWSKTGYNEDGLDYAHGSNKNITGGVFNSTDGSALAGRNSVTNEQFWMLSEGLASIVGPHNLYKVFAQKEQDWFQLWLDLPNSILNSNNLVLERPLGNLAAPNWAWSGDQGLFIEAVSQAPGVSYNGRNAQEIIVDVTYGVTGNGVAGGMTEDGILHENWTAFEGRTAMSGFAGDYATGKGIFMRGLLNVLPFITDPLQSYEVKKFIEHNANVVWKNRGSNDQFTLNWNLNAQGTPPAGQEPAVLTVAIGGRTKGLDDLIMQTSALDALTDAMWVDPNGVIPVSAARR